MTRSLISRQKMIGTECENPENDRADRNVAHDPPFTKDEGRHQPQAERPFLLGDFIIALDEDDLSGP